MGNKKSVFTNISDIISEDIKSEDIKSKDIISEDIKSEDILNIIHTQREKNSILVFHRYSSGGCNNQYARITSWIQHHKDHGDAKYAEAISDLCLDSWLRPNNYNGLTFLYQTNKTVRKKFCDKVFTPESRDACEEFKR